jgi:hypothetical protein
MLVELSVMAQRYQAVLAFGPGRVEGHRGCSRARLCLGRACTPGSPDTSWAAWLPGRPLPSSQRLPAPDRRGGGGADELRREQPGWGPRRIEHQLARREIDPVPARSSICRCLRRHGLIDLRRRRKRATNSGGGSGSGR